VWLGKCRRPVSQLLLLLVLLGSCGRQSRVCGHRAQRLGLRPLLHARLLLLLLLLL
jgi:hypothetical protein